MHLVDRFLLTVVCCCLLLFVFIFEVHEDPEEGVQIDGTGSRFEKARLGDHNVKRAVRERGQLLHLWSENVRRTGWTMLHQNTR